MQKYNDSLPFDRVLWRQDIAGSIAYARANIETGILTREEFVEIEKGFKGVSKEWEDQTFVAKATDEGNKVSWITHKANVLDAESDL